MAADNNLMLSAEEQALLLTIARDSLSCHAQSTRPKNIQDYPLTPLMRQHCGAFVTLHKSGRLRGCIGYIKSVVPLAQTVADNAVNAGYHDPRFEPVEVDELAHIVIEISALLPGGIEEGSPFIPVKDTCEIEIGRDGLYIQHNTLHRDGLLLPQVPVEQGWKLDAYLHGLCMKAGLPFSALNDAACRLYRFRAQVFIEE